MLSLSNSSLNTAHLKGVAAKQPYRNSSLVLAEPKTIYADGEQGKKFVTPTPGEASEDNKVLSSHLVSCKMILNIFSPSEALHC